MKIFFILLILSMVPLIVKADDFTGDMFPRPTLSLEARDRLITEIRNKLVDSQTGEADPLDINSIPRYFVFFRGSSQCSITNDFLPTLINFDKRMKPKHPEYEIIYIMTESDEITAEFAQQKGFSWRALSYNNTPPIPNSVIDGRLPQLFVMDRSGKVLINGIQYDVPPALDKLTALLKNEPGH